MNEKGIVIETCFDPPDGRSFVIIEKFCNLDNFRVGATFWIGEVAVEKTEEGIKATEVKKREEFQLKEIDSRTEALMLVKVGALNQICPGNLVERI